MKRPLEQLAFWPRRVRVRTIEHLDFCFREHRYLRTQTRVQGAVVLDVDVRRTRLTRLVDGADAWSRLGIVRTNDGIQRLVDFDDDAQVVPEGPCHRALLELVSG